MYLAALVRATLALFVGIVIMSGVVAERAATAAQFARATGVELQYGTPSERDETPVDEESSGGEAESEVAETEEDTPGSGLETDELCVVTQPFPPPSMTRLGWVVPTTYPKPIPPPLDPEDQPSEI